MQVNSVNFPPTFPAFLNAMLNCYTKPTPWLGRGRTYRLFLGRQLSYYYDNILGTCQDGDGALFSLKIGELFANLLMQQMNAARPTIRDYHFDVLTLLIGQAGRRWQDSAAAAACFNRLTDLDAGQPARTLILSQAQSSLAGATRSDVRFFLRDEIALLIKIGTC